MAPETPKVVSSRLLTMKFMQRAVASSAASSPASPDTDPQSSSKRRKLQHNPSPAQSRLHAQIDEAAIKAALEDQEAKRQAALSQHLAADSHWVINPSLIKPGASSSAKTTPAPLNVVYVGYGDIDSGNESGYEDSPQIGRTYNQAPKKETEKKKKTENSAKTHNSDSDSGSDSSDGSSSDDSEASDSDEDTGRLSRPQEKSRSQSRSRSRPNLESIRAKDFRDKRRQKEVRLNKITSISSGGGTGSGSGNSSSLSCYNCKQSGHKASNCPKGPSRPPRRG